MQVEQLGQQRQRLAQQDQTNQQNQQMQQAKLLGGAARYLLGAIQSGDPSKIQGAWTAVRNSQGIPQEVRQAMPEQFDAQQIPVIQQVAAQTASLFPDDIKQPQQRGPMVVGHDLVQVGPDGKAHVLYTGQDAAQKPSDMERRVALARQMGATPEQLKQMVLGGNRNDNMVPDVPGNAALTGDAYLKTLDQQTAAQVQALATGRMAFPTGTALKSPYWQGMLGAVSQYDPSFDAVNYNARSGTRKAFTSGAEAKTVNALNTVAEHLGTLSDYADALGNTSFPVLNRIKNGYLSETGDPRIARFNTAKKAAADEVAKVWRSTGGSEADIQENLKNLDGAQSPEQLHAAIGTLVKLIGGKLAALQDQYKQGMGTTRQVKPLVSPEAQTAYEKVLKRAGMTSSDIEQQPATAQGWAIQRVQ